MSKNIPEMPVEDVIEIARFFNQHGVEVMIDGCCHVTKEEPIQIKKLVMAKID